MDASCSDKVYDLYLDVKNSLIDYGFEFLKIDVKKAPFGDIISQRNTLWFFLVLSSLKFPSKKRG